MPANGEDMITIQKRHPTFDARPPTGPDDRHRVSHLDMINMPYFAFGRLSGDASIGVDTLSITPANLARIAV